MIRIFGVLLFLGLFVVPRNAQAESFALEPVADARILSVYPELNWGGDLISVYFDEGNEQRTLMFFDLNGLNIASGDQVVSAVLSLVVSRAYGGSKNLPVEVYRVVSPWAENSVTWTVRLPNQPWSQAGGDYAGRLGNQDANPYATNSDDPPEGGTISWEIASLVQEWLDGASPNNGLLLRAYFGNHLTFPSTESAPGPSTRPKLTITTRQGLPRLSAVFVPPTQIAISWPGENIGSLEENATPTPSGWTQSDGTPTVTLGRTEVRLPISGTAKFFRLKTP